MNSVPNVISQDSGSLTQQQPEHLRGTSERKLPACVHLVYGFAAVICGLYLVALKNRDGYIGYHSARFGKTEFGIWGGLVFIATAIPPILGRHKKSMVGLYFGFCLASAVIAIVGLGLSITAIHRIVNEKTGKSVCNNTAWGIHRHGKYGCCIDDYRNDYDCRPSYNNHYAENNDHVPMTHGFPRLSYYSPECLGFRWFSNTLYGKCLLEAERLYMPHLVFYGIMVTVVSVELFASVYGAFAALSALCNCCIRGEPPVKEIHKRTYALTSQRRYVIEVTTRFPFLKMNPVPNVTSQDSGSLTWQQPKCLRGTFERKRTEVVQLVFGFIAMACGLVLLTFRHPYIDNYYRHPDEEWSGRVAAVILGALVFIAIPTPYFFGRNKRSKVGLWSGFCLAVILIVIVGIGVWISDFNRLVFKIIGTSVCNYVAARMHHDGKYQCCFEDYQYDYDCHPSYNNHYYWNNHHLPRTNSSQQLSYYSRECASFRSFLGVSHEQCVEEVSRVHVPHLVFYGIMVVAVSIELIASVYGTWASRLGLCNYSFRGKPTKYNSFSVNEVTVMTV
ncbi:hypothetical protein HOLleu_40929 [Holothuria leucospilota]|uniref:Tetraspanin n=1 Tax=Holothuria leucospilota TaxID=206669 RepID=A0A9Q0YFT0_HOLLE|nr:hypothetical protein HOLleu_40929 [Holothuria leucospilota]